MYVCMYSVCTFVCEYECIFKNAYLHIYLLTGVHYKGRVTEYIILSLLAKIFVAVLS